MCVIFKLYRGHLFLFLYNQGRKNKDSSSLTQTDRPGRLEELDPDFMEEEEREDQS